MYCRLLLKLILRDKAVWISTLVLAAAFSVPIAFNSPIYGPFFMKQGMQGFVDAFNTRAPQASGTDLSPEQQDDAELARYANAALAAQTDAAFLDSAESYYALMDEGFQSGSICSSPRPESAARDSSARRSPSAAPSSWQPVSSPIKRSAASRCRTNRITTRKGESRKRDSPFAFRPTRVVETASAYGLRIKPIYSCDYMSVSTC